MRYLKTLAPQGFFWRAGATMYGKSGVSDILGIYKGHAVALEVKKPGGKHPLTPNQAAFLDSFFRANGFIGVVSSVEEVKRILKGIDWSKDIEPIELDPA